LGNIQVVHLPKGASVEKFIERYQESGLVEYAEPDHLGMIDQSWVPNDPMFNDGTLWGLNNTSDQTKDIDALQGWQAVRDASNVVVAVIDQGVRYTHEDLADNVWVNEDEIPGNGIDDDGNGYVDDIHGINARFQGDQPWDPEYMDRYSDPNPQDWAPHGTHVAGTVGGRGDNGKGVIGVAPFVKIMALRWIPVQDFLYGWYPAAISDAIECIEYAIENGAHIMNNSWRDVDGYSQALYDAIAMARDPNGDGNTDDGIIFVASAGNQSANTDHAPQYPASFDLDNIVSVAATDSQDTLAGFSNYGAESVDLAAPGAYIWSTYFSPFSQVDNEYMWLDGTSMAAPHVAGALALLKAQHPTENYRQLITRLYWTTDRLDNLIGKCRTEGRLNLNRLLTENPPDLCVLSKLGFSASGGPGGPFVPAKRTYTLTNFSGTNLTWSVSCDQNWVSFSSTGGVLSAGQSLDVDVYFNANAEALGKGTYSGTITFTNVTADVSTTRDVTLTVNVIHVKPGGTGNGSSWSNALGSVQAGLDAARDQNIKQVWVAAGTYDEVVTFGYNHDGIGLYGGFAGTETRLEQRPAFPRPLNDPYRSTLCGSSRQVVGINSCPGPSTRLDGFTIDNKSSGAGVYAWAYNRRLSVTIANNTITGNCGWPGAGVCIDAWGGGTTIVKDNIITGNVSDYYNDSNGGGIACYGASCVITGNTITNNVASRQGGGVLLECCENAVVVNNVIADNFVTGFTSAYSEPHLGGGIFVHGGRALIANNTIVGNWSQSGEGGAIYCAEKLYGCDDDLETDVRIINNIIAHNSSGVLKDGITPTIANNCMWDNGSYDFKDRSGDPWAPTGNLAADPDLASRQYGRWHIQPGSPCRDAGDDSVVQAQWPDMDEQPRVQGAHVDIGADESDGTVWPEAPAIIRVSPGGSGNGSSWASPMGSVQAAIDAASVQGGGEVWVKAGTYYERLNLRSYVDIYGGFSGAETTRDQRDWTTNVTTIDASGATAGRAVTAAGVKATVDGFTLRNGTGGLDYIGYSSGGAVYACSSWLELANNVISNNSAEYYGGGVCYTSSGGSIRGNTIRDNTESGYGSGGGIYCSRSMLSIVGNVIAGNVGYMGGGIYADCAIDIACNIIRGNQAAQYCKGGGICLEGSDKSYVVNNTIVENTCANSGAGVYLSSGVTVFANNIVAYNVGQGLGGYADIRHNCFWQNTTDYAPGSTLGPNNISVDPQFVNRAAGDFHLIVGSECGDNGDNAVLRPDWLDIDKEARIQPTGGVVDIGADEMAQTEMVATPTFSPDGGTFDDYQSVTIGCSTPGAEIHYTTDGSRPGLSSPLYTGPVSIQIDSTLQARAFKPGYAPSNIKSAEYTINKTAPPFFIPPPGAYEEPIDVYIDWPDEYAYVVYTTDGTEPDDMGNGIWYSWGDSISVSTNTTFKAKAFRWDIAPSDTVTAVYVFGQVATPVISPSGGTYGEPQTVTITCNSANAEIRYTLDGAEPTQSSALYTAPFVVSENTTVKAKAWKGTLTPSEVASARFEFRAAAPVIDPPSGEYEVPQTITMTCATPGAQIYYTLDGTDPTESSTLYGGSFIVSQDTTIKARAFKANMLPSDIVSEAYQIRNAIYVKVGTPAGDDGLTWETAYDSIQDAIDNSAPGQQIRVAAGIYYENIVVDQDVELLGGYLGSGTTRDPSAHVTVIDGQGESSVVRVLSGTTSALRIDGFTLQNGAGTGVGTPFGGGIYCQGEATVSNNIITACYASFGAGISCVAGSGATVIEGNRIIGNDGVGIDIQGSCTPRVLGNYIAQQAYTGILVWSSASGIEIVNNIIYGNGSSNDLEAGGIRCMTGSRPIITNNTIVDNRAGDYGGGGIKVDQNASPQIYNNIVAFNYASYGGGGIHAYNTAAVVENNNVFDNRSGGVNMGNYFGITPSASNISAEPGLLSISEGDFHLAGTSAGIDAGLNSAPGIAATDIDGQNRLYNGTVDIGADEYSGETRSTVATPTISPDGGLYGDFLNVTISCSTPGAVIYFTNDGTEPTENSSPYTGPIMIPGSMVIKAKAWKSGMNPSDTKTSTFTLKVATPVLSPSGGTFGGPIDVTITCPTFGAGITYTLDGSEPIESGTPYTGPITISETTTIKARAWYDGMDGSDTVSATYEILTSNIRYVKAGTPAGDNGLSWETAYDTVQDAIDHAQPGYEIRVAQGVYQESIDINTDIVLLGGYLGTGDTRDPTAYVTCLDAGDMNNVITVGSGLGRTTVIDGFTIRNGMSVYGAGILCFGSPTIAHNVIEDNDAAMTACLNGRGGGIRCIGGSPLISHNLIRNNDALFGGGICADSGASPVIVNNIIAGNDALYDSYEIGMGGFGAGIYCAGASAVITGNTIVGNISDGYGGGRGGGICGHSGSIYMANNIIAFNTDGVSSDGTVQWQMYNNNLFGNLNYDYEAGIPAGAGDISQDPAFMCRTQGDYRLVPGSLCIDAGLDTALAIPATDFGGQSRIYGDQVDIGADEYNGESWTHVATPSISPDGGAYGSPPTVTMSCATPDAVIHYTVDGSDPTEDSPVYSSPFVAPENATVKARAWKSGQIPSDIRSVVYTSKVATPVLSPPGGTYITSVQVSITCATPGATIRYTMDGSTPTASSPVYTGPITVDATTGYLDVPTTPIKARAFLSGCPDSDIAFQSYTIKAATPTFSPDGGTYGSVQYVTIQCATPGTTIYYTTDGTTPSITNGRVYSVPVPVSQTLTLKAVAIRHGCQGSDVKSADYIIQQGAGVRFVDSDAPGPTHDGLSWATAFRTIQAGIDAAGIGGEVWVASGTYVENLTLRNGVALYGGFYGNEASRDARNWTTHPTTISGDGYTTAVTVQSGSHSNTRIDGFRIVNGGLSWEHGAGDTGAGIYCSGSTVTIANNKISESGTMGSMTWGGGIGCIGSNVTITGNWIEGNEAWAGGGMSIVGCSGQIENNVIVDNDASIGGGIHVSGSEITIMHNTLVGNSAFSDGGGISFEGGAVPTIKNNIVAFGSSGIHKWDGAPSPSLSYNNVYGNTNYDYSTGVNAGIGAISANPVFVNQASGDYHLMLYSPCVDACPSGSTTDYEGNTRPADGNGDGLTGYDIGAYETMPAMAGIRHDLPDGTRVYANSIPVTACFTIVKDTEYWVYVENAARTRGIRVKCAVGKAIGELVNITGTMRTDTANGERYIEADAGFPVTVLGHNHLGALGMRNEWIGGAAPSPCPVLKDGFGFYNTGMLVQTWGRVTYTTDGYFYINDGSNLIDGSGHSGLRVIGSSWVPCEGDFVKVIGISSAVKIGANYVRAIRVRNDDIAVINDHIMHPIHLSSSCWNMVTLPGIPIYPGAESVFRSCHGLAGIVLDGYLKRYDAQYQAWIHFQSCGGPFNCLVAEGYGLYVPPSGTDCYDFLRAYVSSDQFISLPRGSDSASYFSFVGQPFDYDRPWSSIQVTNGSWITSLPQAVSLGWVHRVDGWNGVSWQPVTDLWTGSMAKGRGYCIYPKVGGLALIVPQ